MGIFVTTKINFDCLARNFSHSRENHVVQMSILKFIRPISNCFDGELPCSVSTATIKEVSRQVQEVQKSGKKRGHYSKFSEKEKALVGKYASEHGVLKAVRHFKDMNLKESTVRDWREQNVSRSLR